MERAAALPHKAAAPTVRHRGGYGPKANIAPASHTRHLFIRQQTSVINAIRAHLAEFGIVAPVGRNGVEQLLGIAADANDKRLPEVARTGPFPKSLVPFEN